jgi:hypothetical protein
MEKFDEVKQFSSSSTDAISTMKKPADSTSSPPSHSVKIVELGYIVFVVTLYFWLAVVISGLFSHAIHVSINVCIVVSCDWEGRMLNCRFDF